jgi:hypothetical protein
VVAAGPPDVVRADPKALAAYLGASDEAIFASGPTGTNHAGPAASAPSGPDAER